MTGASCWWDFAGGQPRSEAGLRARCRGVRLVPLILLLAALGCGRATHEYPAAEVAPWLRADPQRCLLTRDLSEGMEFMAKRCAEEFVLQNGYTDQPASDDSTRWVLEVGETGSWPGVFAGRVGTLDREGATVQCSMRQCIVLFRLRRPILSCAYRAVTMTQVFTKLQLAPGGIRDVRCGDRRA
jgi:hypothetical protein